MKQPFGASTVLLRARDLLGNDIRHFVLVYLLANERGGKLQAVQKWSGYTYRSISEVAARWHAAGVAIVEHGYAYLTEAQAWRSLLHLAEERITIVNWFVVFEACVTLLRALAKARRMDFADDNPVVTSYRNDAYRALSAPFIDGAPGDAPSTARLRNLFPEEEQHHVKFPSDPGSSRKKNPSI